MAVPRVNKKLLQELETMGFPTAWETRALHYSGGFLVYIFISSFDSPLSISFDRGYAKLEICRVYGTKLKGSWVLWCFMCLSKWVYLQFMDQTRKKRKEEEKKLELQMEREREKRIRSGKELMEAKQILEDNERKCNIAFRNSEKEEEKRARERIRWKLEQDKKSLPVRSVAKSEHMRECLRSLRRNHKVLLSACRFSHLIMFGWIWDDDARVRRAFQTLLIYVGNVAKNPDQEKFRKIRLSNPSFSDRVGRLIGGIEFLELCGFERTEAGEFL
ncbi:putative peptide-N(4)-(N-acetyl-beta-glucosaminyl)asparagine amidase [Rosa chinensis]|uniref:Putative peptide-N(4)-(N-acetyl-beta-glucosaminyl)asparagine amidase n=1 Tax=Rosa chinensis TaxID=74649 RepID=A0A2P6PUA3_ROSCH|nr:putative peptide-N(4)-(N-acetyl-beta-glucosaminyl)asparagine amidase [Rosa chinensis]